MSALSRLVRSTYRTYTRHRTAISILIGVLVLETLYNVNSYKISKPSRPLDPPFSTQCHEPDTSSPRENATILMLARNSDLAGAVDSVRSVENAFNHWYHYPITFLNDQPFSEAFISALTSVASGPVSFATIDSTLWGYPPLIDQAAAKQSIASQGKTNVMYAGHESYHHMCRFNSGGFYDVPELQAFRWYWRIEPDVQYTCAITYDPFVAMARAGKKYGYVVALWEIGDTCPSLFRTVADYKRKLGVRTTGLWTAMMDASWAPVPVRWMLGLLANRDRSGDAYNLCHFWSNFEIADMDWYRSDEYRAFFRMLDEEGGFYFERVRILSKPEHYELS